MWGCSLLHSVDISICGRYMIAMKIKRLMEMALLAVFLLFLAVGGVQAQGKKAPITQIEIIFDDSGSMWGQIGGKAKVDIAKEAFGVLIDDIFKKQADLEIGLRVYGHLNKRCDNSVLEVPIGKGQQEKLKVVVAGLKPLGKTPITYSLEKSAADFDQKKTGDRIIVLLTDGIESCDGDPCAAARKLQAAGVVTKIHVVGFGMKKSELDTLACIAAPSKGLLIGASSAGELRKAFEKIVDETVRYNLEIQAVDDSDKAILADYSVYPAGKTVDPVAQGDTSMDQKALLLVPAGTYDIKVINGQTKKELWLKGVAVDKKKRTVRRVAFGERKLKLICKKTDGTINSLCEVYVYDKAGTELMYRDTSMKYAEMTLEPGVYDVKVINYDSKKEGWLKDIDLTSERKLTKEIVVE